MTSIKHLANRMHRLLADLKVIHHYHILKKDHGVPIFNYDIFYLPATWNYAEISVIISPAPNPDFNWPSVGIEGDRNVLSSFTITLHKSLLRGDKISLNAWNSRKIVTYSSYIIICLFRCVKHLLNLLRFNMNNPSYVVDELDSNKNGDFFFPNS